VLPTGTEIFHLKWRGAYTGGAGGAGVGVDGVGAVAVQLTFTARRFGTSKQGSPPNVFGSIRIEHRWWPLQSVFTTSTCKAQTVRGKCRRAGGGQE
jgi:hypothetical protein